MKKGLRRCVRLRVRFSPPAEGTDDLMKKGLRRHSTPMFPRLFRNEGTDDLMKKGLRQTVIDPQEFADV